MPADKSGAIVVPDQAKLTPVSGIVILPDDDPYFGKRVYFRPYTDVRIPLGTDPRHAPEVGVVHVRDILMAEELSE